ncbi:MAG: dihydrodipicolinate synthase family protein [Clostridiales bacterium]|nr:MAG: dihydrodipicolinate synthase family protein [Clostridiales bacterium]
MNVKDMRGVWVTMVTPFDEEYRVDYSVMKDQVEWYIGRGVNGIFAVCQSSEMDLLDRAERKKIAETVVKAAAGRVPVVASGHLSDGLEEQLRDVESIREAGVDAVVLVTNRFAGKNEGEDVFLKNLDVFLNRVDSSVSLGMYECPSPYKRLLSDREMSYCAQSGRIGFFKDTSCETERMKKRVEVTKSSGLRIFNANSATLLQSLRDGVAGYSGVMANFHPELYGWLCRHFDDEPEKAERLSAFLSVASMSECRNYPDCAKYYMKKELPQMGIYSRKIQEKDLPEFIKREINSLELLTQEFRRDCGIRM